MAILLAMSSYFKGEELLREAKRQGAHVILLTEEKLRHDPWPWEAIDELFLMPNLSNLTDVIHGVAYLARTRKIDRIIPLDEYDVETAAFLREHMRMTGPGLSATKLFRDKLAMRVAIKAAGLPEPQFTPVINHDDVREWTWRVPAPWVLKPRLEAGAMGIKRVPNEGELWQLIEQLGDQQSFRVLEQYVPGDVYHVDAMTVNGETVFATVSRYGRPPLNVSHDGGVFMTYSLPDDHPEAQALIAFNRKVIQALGHTHGPTHAEFIKAHHDGQFNFLEIAARVGGAHIADLIEHTRGINLWGEWARLELMTIRGEAYQLPPIKNLHGALMVCLARQHQPDLSAYDDPEVIWRLDKARHAGLIVASPDAERIAFLRNSYVERFSHDFLAVAPAKDSHTQA
ncbi:MAG: ATP-grasp domain-containing protein [Anaerolineae bacterium]|nr:ATP-grasp domain-containing protein [Anaerolineae bacterium]